MFFEHESHEYNESYRLRHGMYSWDSREITSLWSVGLRQISWSTEFNSYANMFFSNTNRTNLTNLVGCDMVYIRGIREICGHLNIIQTRICFFSNTNRTNLTNLVGCDMVCIWEITSLWSVGLRQISWSCIIGPHVRIVTLHGYRN